MNLPNEMKMEIRKEIKKIRRQLKDVDCDNSDYFWEHIYNDYKGNVINKKDEHDMEILRKYAPK
jgi:hypothetical protein